MRSRVWGIDNQEILRTLRLSKPETRDGRKPRKKKINKLLTLNPKP